jgi:hypothetical protein
MAKSCNREICYFPYPFSSKQHQNLFTNEILPLKFGFLIFWQKNIIDAKAAREILMKLTTGGLIYHYSHDPIQLEITMDYSIFDVVDDSEEKLTMETFMVLFIFLLVGIPIAFIALLIEKHVYKRQRMNQWRPRRQMVAS